MAVVRDAGPGLNGEKDREIWNETRLYYPGENRLVYGCVRRHCRLGQKRTLRSKEPHRVCGRILCAHPQQAMVFAMSPAAGRNCQAVARRKNRQKQQPAKQ